MANKGPSHCERFTAKTLCNCNSSASEIHQKMQSRPRQISASLTTLAGDINQRLPLAAKCYVITDFAKSFYIENIKFIAPWLRNCDTISWEYLIFLLAFNSQRIQNFY